MGKGYGYSNKMPSKGKKSANKKSNGGDKGMSGAGVPVDSSAKAVASAGYGSANVKGSPAKTWC
jgi:hypothetical protein